MFPIVVPAAVGADPGILVTALAEHGPFELVYGPAGYGLPLVDASQVGERELELIVLVREDEPPGPMGVGGMRAIVRALIEAGLPLVFGPGAIHLPTIPAYRKWNRIDLGTADKVASAALCIGGWLLRRGIRETEEGVKAAQLDPDYRAALLKFGIEIDHVGPEPFADFIHAESRRWTPILKDAGVTFE